jgi:uncharacterized membrane protein YfcA
MVFIKERFLSRGSELNVSIHKLSCAKLLHLLDVNLSKFNVLSVVESAHFLTVHRKMSIEIIILLILLGSFVGVVAGLLGAGGGGILVPALSSLFLFMEFPAEKIVHLSLGTSMAAIVVTSFSSMKAHKARDGVDWHSVRFMTPGVVVGTFAATFLVAVLNSVFLAGFFALFMTLVSIQMWRPIKFASGRSPSNQELMGVGGGVGAISALVSIGGGSLTVPYLSWRGHELKRAVGTSAAMGLPISVIGTLGYLYNGWPQTDFSQYIIGYVYWPAVLVISCCTVITAPMGVKIAHKLPVPTLRKIFSLLLITIAMKMFYSIVTL